MIELSQKTKLYIVLAVAVILVLIYFRIRRSIHKRRYARENSIEYALDTGEFIDARAFLREREELKGTNSRQSQIADLEFSGCYVLYNVKDQRYYVGKSDNCLYRVTRHLQGHGNAAVYSDMMLLGKPFKLQLIPLCGSGYMSLNAMEKDLISSYKAKETGYNIQAGNR